MENALIRLFRAVTKLSSLLKSVDQRCFKWGKKVYPLHVVVTITLRYGRHNKKHIVPHRFLYSSEFLKPIESIPEYYFGLLLLL